MADEQVNVTLLTRNGCHLCETALAQLTPILSGYGLAPDVVDVDRAADQGDPGLRAEYGDRLPVVLLDGTEHSYWEIDEARLRSDLDRLLRVGGDEPRR
ncbi:MAG: glutaredoxin family protein [Gordonia sp. (in: high G+C Gram-positive bacteria)]|uniref:glutaredoxin family protein n=1 Tax=Gordonia sp. (in: high G+C Gram-positive bacteria) TaxID=84139 RepID=UPI0039E4184C